MFSSERIVRQQKLIKYLFQKRNAQSSSFKYRVKHKIEVIVIFLTFSCFKRKIQTSLENLSCFLHKRKNNRHSMRYQRSLVNFPIEVVGRDKRRSRGVFDRYIRTAVNANYRCILYIHSVCNPRFALECDTRIAVSRICIAGSRARLERRF